MDDRILPVPNVPHFNLANPQYTIKNPEDYVIDSRFAVPSALTTTHAVYLQEQLRLGRFLALLSLRQEWFEDVTNYEAPGEASFINTALIPPGGTYLRTHRPGECVRDLPGRISAAVQHRHAHAQHRGLLLGPPTPRLVLIPSSAI